MQNFELKSVDSIEVHMPAPKSFFLRIGCKNGDALVISSVNYSLLIKLYAALSSLTDPAMPMKGAKKIMAPGRYGTSCCKPKKTDKKVSKYALAQPK